MLLGEQDRLTLMAKLRAQAVIYDPFLERTDATQFELKSPLWPNGGWSVIIFDHLVEGQGRQVLECRYVPADSRVPFLPVAIVLDPAATDGPTAYIYSDHHLVSDRAPILRPKQGIHPWRSEDDVLFHYFHALNGNRIEEVLNLFEEEGYFGHSNAQTFKGRAALREDFTAMMGQEGIRIQYCRFTDDGTTCVVECYMPSGRPAIAVYQRARAGRLHAVRIYL